MDVFVAVFVVAAVVVVEWCCEERGGVVEWCGGEMLWVVECIFDEDKHWVVECSVTKGRGGVVVCCVDEYGCGLLNGASVKRC